MKKRSILFLLIFSLLLPSFASCASSPEERNETPADNPAASETAPEAAEEEEVGIRSLSAVPEDLDFGGADFNIESRTTSTSVSAEELTGEGVNDAVFIRNQMTEEALNVKIHETKGDACLLNNTVASITAGDQGFSAAMTHITQMAEYEKTGYFINLDNVPYLDLTQPYWSKGVTDSLTISGKSFLFCGDLSLLDNTNIWCIYFNKDLLGSLGLESPYTALDEGRWTLDFYAKQIEAGASDLNGDGQWNWQDDQFALLNPKETLCGMYNSMGQVSIFKDSDGHMIYNLEDENSMNALMKLTEWAVTGAGTTFLEASQISTGEPWIDLRSVFAAGRALYYNHVIAVIVEYLRDMENEYGILPMPKYDENQENYISSTQEWGQCVYAVPICAPDVNMSGAVLEYMGGVSTDTVRSAYYDVALTRKYSRDTESIKSLDILFNNVVIDLGFSFMGMQSSVSNALANGTIASTLKSSKKVTEKNIEKVEKQIAELQN